MTLRAGALPGLMNQPTAQIIDGSLRFINNSKYLTRTPDEGNRRTWTWSGWFKRDAIGANDDIFNVAGSSSKATQFTIMIHNGNFISIDYGGAFYLKSDRLIRDLSSWYNFVVRVDTTISSPANDRVRLYVNGVEETSFNVRNNPNENEELGLNRNSAHTISSSGSSGFDGRFCNFYLIDGKSLGPENFGFTDPLTNTWRPKKFDSFNNPNNGTTWSNSLTTNAGDNFDASGAKTKAFDGDGSNKAFTANNSDGTTQDTSYLEMVFPSAISGALRVKCDNGNTVRDVTGGGDVLLATQSTGSDNQFVDCGTVSGLTNLRVLMSGGSRPAISIIEIDGYVFLDGAVDNSFYLPMDNEDDFEIDKSGNQNNFSKNSYNGTFIDPDVNKDSPSGAVSGGRGQTGITTTSSAPANYATLNPLNTHSDFDSFSEGNLKVSGKSNNAYRSVFSTLGASEGKFYFEVIPTSNGANGMYIGITRVTRPRRGMTQDNGHDGYAWKEDGGFYGNDTTLDSGYGTDGYTDNDVIGVAVDLDGGNITYSKNGTSIGTANYGSSSRPPAFSNATFYAAISMYQSSSAAEVNFGQKPFKYAPPQGYLPLNSASATPQKVITRPDEYVGIVTYTGDDNPRNIFGLNMKPDLIWIKNKGATQKHTWVDSVRTTATGEYIASSDDAAQGTGVHISGIENGISIDDPNASTIWYNDDSYDYVAWCWKAGGKPTATNNNTSGAMDANSVSVDGVLQSAYTPSGSPTIYPTGMSVGTKQGFSIIRYQANSTAGATIPHGLSQAPDFVLVKSLETAGSSNSDWTVFHKSLGGTKAMYLNEQDGSGATGSWNDTDPNANVITLGTAHVSNLSPNHYIAYAWHDVPGLQKFGSYGDSDSGRTLFVELGFRPAILIIKSESSSRNWIIIDSERDKFNPSDIALLVNDTAVEDNNSVYAIDFLSNGFLIRGSNGQIDGDASYVYAAWAEAPAFNLYGGQSSAR